jgi:hypothetical protein
LKYDAHTLNKLFSPFDPLYLRKLTDVDELKKVLTGVLHFSNTHPIIAMSMSIGLYESHKELYLQLVGTAEHHEVVDSQIEIMRTTLKSVIDHAPYNDYLITLWSCTGDLQYMIELVKRTKSSIEEVSATAAWALDTIAQGSEVFATAVDQACNIN